MDPPPPEIFEITPLRTGDRFKGLQNVFFVLNYNVKCNCYRGRCCFRSNKMRKNRQPDRSEFAGGRAQPSSGRRNNV